MTAKTTASDHSEEVVRGRDGDAAPSTAITGAKTAKRLA